MVPKSFFLLLLVLSIHLCSAWGAPHPHRCSQHPGPRPARQRGGSGPFPSPTQCSPSISGGDGLVFRPGDLQLWLCLGLGPLRGCSESFVYPLPFFCVSGSCLEGLTLRWAQFPAPCLLEPSMPPLPLPPPRSGSPHPNPNPCCSGSRVWLSLGVRGSAPSCGLWDAAPSVPPPSCFSPACLPQRPPPALPGSSTSLEGSLKAPGRGTGEAASPLLDGGTLFSTLFKRL